MEKKIETTISIFPEVMDMGILNYKREPMSKFPTKLRGMGILNYKRDRYVHC